MINMSCFSQCCILNIKLYMLHMLSFSDCIILWNHFELWGAQCSWETKFLLGPVQSSWEHDVMDSSTTSFFVRMLVCWDVNLLIWVILTNIDSPDQCWWFHSMLHMLLFSACMLCFTCFHSLLPAELFVVLLEEKNRERHLNNISEFLRSELRPTEPMEKLVLPDVVSRCLKISVDNHANIRVTTPRIFTRFITSKFTNQEFSLILTPVSICTRNLDCKECTK